MTLPVPLRRCAPLVLFFLVAFASLGCVRGAERTDLDAGSAARVPKLAAKIHAAPLSDRFVQASALFLGTTYRDGPLGEGDAGGPDPDPRVDFSAVDCVTYLEQSLALALCGGRDSAAAAPDAFLRVLDRIRYHDGQVGFVQRNHYMMRDWVPANAWLVEDVTDRLAPGAAVTLTHTIDRAKFLRDKGVTPRPGLDDAGPLSMKIVPREAVASVAAAIRSGDLVFWAAKKDGIDVAHTGLAVRDRKGKLRFRHASPKAGKVVEESLADYAAHATFAAGIVVVRLREDAAPPLSSTPPSEAPSPAAAPAAPVTSAAPPAPAPQNPQGSR
ncbi:MAG: DUF1460 domain-containing protein [bacterium]